MASPVDTTVKYLHSGMSGAPVLQGQAGSLISMLDACLVTGFDTKTPTSLMVASGVATLAYSGGHSAEVNSVILVEGVTGALTALNGEQKVTFKSSTEIRFATAAANGTAAGAITFKMAPCGWAKVFTDTNKAVYKALAITANGHFLRVDDTVAAETRVFGFETMSDIDTGSGQFPLPAQLSAFGAIAPEKGGYWSKGSNANTNPIAWVFFGDTRLFMYGPSTYQSQIAIGDVSRNNYTQCQLRGFGDPLATRPSGDVYNTTLACGGSPNHASSTEAGSFSGDDVWYGGLFTARAFTGLGGSELHSLRAASNPFNQSAMSGINSQAYGSFPSAVDGGIRLVERFMKRRVTPTAADHAVRAVIPGILYVPMSEVYRNLPPKTVITGTGKYAGRALVAVGTGPYSSDTAASPDSCGISFMDITGPWR